MSCSRGHSPVLQEGKEVLNAPKGLGKESLGGEHAIFFTAQGTAFRY